MDLTSKAISADSEKEFYWQYYGLLRDPFAPNYDPAMAFVSPAWEQHLDSMQHWLVVQNAVVCIYGPKGRGKSTLLQLFLSRLIDLCEVFTLDGQADLNASTWLEWLQEKYMLSPSTEPSLETQLEHATRELQHQEKTAVVLIDQAHNLPDDTLHAIFYMICQQSRQQMRFHVVLFGDNDLQSRIAKLGHDLGQEEMIQSIELQPLSADETASYIRQRLMKAGLRESLPFEPSVFERIYEMSQGNPEDINQNSQDFLMDELDRQKTELPPTFTQKYQTHLIGVGVLGVIFIIIMGLLVRTPSKNIDSKINSETTSQVLSFNNSNASAASNGDTISTATPTAPINSQANTPINANANAPTAGAPLSTPVANNNPAALPAAMPSTQAQTNPVPAGINHQAVPVTQAGNNPPLTNPPGTMANSSNEATRPHAMATAPTPAVPLNNTAHPSNPMPAAHSAHANVASKSKTTSTQMATTASNTMAAANTPSSNKPLEELNLGTLNSSDNAAESTSSVSKKASKSHQLAEKKAHPAKSESKSEKNSELASNRYTLQLVALSDKKNLNKFIAANHLQGKVHTFTRQKDGKTLYILSYGSFNSQQAAKAEIAKLPKTLQTSAWPRKAAMIKKESQG